MRNTKLKKFFECEASPLSKKDGDQFDVVKLMISTDHIACVLDNSNDDDGGAIMLLKESCLDAYKESIFINIDNRQPRIKIKQSFDDVVDDLVDCGDEYFEFDLIREFSMDEIVKGNKNTVAVAIYSDSINFVTDYVHDGYDVDARYILGDSLISIEQDSSKALVGIAQNYNSIYGQKNIDASFLIDGTVRKAKQKYLNM